VNVANRDNPRPGSRLGIPAIGMDGADRQEGSE
jgi:hypothetical protein